MRCDMRPPRGGYQPPITPGGGYRLRRAPECLRGGVANGQRSTDSIGAPRRERRGDLRRRRRRCTPGTEVSKVHGAADDDRPRDRSRNARSPGGQADGHWKATPVWPPGAHAITRPTEGGPAAWRQKMTQPTGPWKRATRGRRPRGTSPDANRPPGVGLACRRCGGIPRVRKAHATSLKRTAPRGCHPVPLTEES